MALRSFARLKPDEICDHCGLTLRDKRKHNSSAAPCAASIGSGPIICTEVSGPADIRDEERWSWSASAPGGWIGSILHKKTVDLAAAAVVEELNRLRSIANDPARGLRDRTKAAQQTERLERLSTRAEEAKRVCSPEDYAEAKALVRQELLRIEKQRTKGLTGIAPGLPPVQHKPLVDNIQQRLAGQYNSAYRSLSKLVRQPARGAYPAMEAAPFADSDGRLAVGVDNAVILSANSRGQITSMQVMSPPGGLGGKYKYGQPGEGWEPTGEAKERLEELRKLFQSAEDARGKAIVGSGALPHLGVTTDKGVDSGALWGNLAVAKELLGKARLDAVAICDSSLKPLLATLTTGTITLGTPGAAHHTSFCQIEAALQEVAEALGRKPQVFVCVDAGDAINFAGVQGIVLNTRAMLVRAGYEASILWWSQTTKADQDIDELGQRETLFSGLTSDSFERLTPKEFVARIPPEPLEIAERRLQGMQKFGAHLLEEEEVAQLPIELPHEIDTTIEFYEPTEGAREAKIRDLMDRGFRSILIADPTGQGKTFWAMRRQPQDFGDNIKRLILTSPTALTLADESGWTPLRGKDYGRVRTDDGRLVRAERGTPEDQLTLRANCLKGEEIERLRQAHAHNSAIDACKQCEHRGVCSIKKGLYLADREHTAVEARIVADPASVQAQNDIWDCDGNPYNQHSPGAGTVLIVDEVDSVSIDETLKVSTDEIKSTLAVLDNDLTGSAKALVAFLSNIVKPSGFEIFGGKELRDALIKIASNPVNGGLSLQAVGRSLLEAANEQEIRVSAKNSPLHICWLEPLAQFLRGNDGITAWVDRDGLQFCRRNYQTRQLIGSEGLAAVVFMDATSSAKEIEQRFGTRCAVIQARVPEPKSKPRDIQIVGLGQIGATRSPVLEMLLNRLKPLIPSLVGIPNEEADARLGWIDKKSTLYKYRREQKTVAWMGASRGSNFLQGVDCLTMIGTPTANLTAMAARWTVMTGKSVSTSRFDTINAVYAIEATNAPAGQRWAFFGNRSDNADYRRWAHQQTAKELLQGRGRGRFNRRDDGAELSTVLVTDAPAPWPVEVIHVQEVIGKLTYEGIKKLTRQHIEAVWRRLAKRTGEALAAELEVDIHTLNERFAFADLASSRIAKFVAQAATDASAEAQQNKTSQSVDINPELTAKLVERQQTSAQVA